MPSDWKLPAPASGAGWPEIEALMVAVAWCLWLLLEFLIPQSKNKLVVMATAQDPDPVVVAGSICRSGTGILDQSLLLAARHGGEIESELVVLDCQLLDLRQRSFEAAPGSSSTVVSLQPPSILVVGRPLPPPSSAMAYSGRRLQVDINLQAMMPKWRPFGSTAVGSRSFAPSGNVPGGEVLDGGVMRRHGGCGAGPDGFSSVIFRVLSAKCPGLVVIFLLFWSLSVIVFPPLNESF